MVKGFARGGEKTAAARGPSRRWMTVDAERVCALLTDAGFATRNGDDKPANSGDYRFTFRTQGQEDYGMLDFEFEGDYYQRLVDKALVAWCEAVEADYERLSHADHVEFDNSDTLIAILEADMREALPVLHHAGLWAHITEWENSRYPRVIALREPWDGDPSNAG